MFGGGGGGGGGGGRQGQPASHRPIICNFMRLACMNIF